MSRRRAALALLGAASCAVFLARCSDGPPTAPVLPQAETITEAGVRNRIGVIADDSMRGRDTPSPELDKLAAYIAREFQGFGLRPGLPYGSFLQIYSTRSGPPDTGVVPAARSDQSLEDGGSAPNAAAILDGSDPVLRDEYVLFVAHMDHLGIGEPVNGDSIYNGADDNASGTAAVLELARAFSELDPRPHRSMIFLLVSGEEKGFWGSQYYVHHPAVPLERTVAALNFDMIGRNARDSVLVIGTDLTTLGRITADVGQGHPELGMRPIGIPWPFGGSDHVPFAKSGVPILFFFAGLHGDYHQPSDVVERIDAEKEARIVRLAFYIGLEIANRALRPVWDPEGWRRVMQGKSAAQ